MSAGEEIHLHTIDRDGDEHMQCENSMENKKNLIVNYCVIY